MTRLAWTPKSSKRPMASVWLRSMKMVLWEMVSGDEAGVVDVGVLYQPRFELDAGFAPGDVVAQDFEAGAVAEHVLDAGQHPAGGGVDAADGGVLDGDIAGVAQADA